MQGKLWRQNGSVLETVLLSGGSVQLWGTFFRIGQKVERERGDVLWSLLRACSVLTVYCVFTMSFGVYAVNVGGYQ